MLILSPLQNLNFRERGGPFYPPNSCRYFTWIRSFIDWVCERRSVAPVGCLNLFVFPAVIPELLVDAEVAEDTEDTPRDKETNLNLAQENNLEICLKNNIERIKKQKNLPDKEEEPLVIE